VYQRACTDLALFRKVASVAWMMPPVVLSEKLLPLILVFEQLSDSRPKLRQPLTVFPDSVESLTKDRFMPLARKSPLLTILS